ncbi:MAG: BrnA antitoxin family protein [Bacteroidales bacterium]|nr:BrnA antitoxin family protein [Bacteroidales bacterium]
MLEWLKQAGSGYQTRTNAILRQPYCRRGS